MKLCRCGEVVQDKCPRCYKPSKRFENFYTNEHRKASERYRAEHPLCECCMMRFGVMSANPSRDMHHIVKIVDNRDMKMDSNNWLALCRDCHQEIEGNTTIGYNVKQWSLANYNEVINDRT
jgi:hypothetical protein